eukprot:jgi/Chrzof1/2833/Cz12g00150.t1
MIRVLLGLGCLVLIAAEACDTAAKGGQTSSLASTAGHTARAVQAIKSLYPSCALPYLPNLCWNEQHPVAAFPTNTSEAYVTVCDYKELSFNVSGAMQCLMLIKSALTTIPRHSFVLMVRQNTTIHKQYQALLDKWKVHVVKYAPFEIPKEAVRFHTLGKHLNWIISYQKLNMWKLIQYDRLLFLDGDMVVLDNLDFLFALRHDALACDCLPHGFDEEPNNNTGLMDYGYKHGGVGNSGIVLFTPSLETFDHIRQRLRDAVHPVTKNWAYWGGDQQLTEELFGHHYGRKSLLPANIQTFPDICFRFKDPMFHFPVHRFYILHNTWARWAKYGHWDDIPDKFRNSCWDDMMAINKYFRDKVFADAKVTHAAAKP